MGPVQLDAQQRGSVVLPADLTAGQDLRLAVQFDEAPLVWDAFTVAGPSSAVPLTATAATRCVAGRVVLAATVTNPRAEAATVDIRSPYGEKLSVSVAAGRTATASFASKRASIPAGVVTVTDAADAPFAARSCG